MSVQTAIAFLRYLRERGAPSATALGAEEAVEVPLERLCDLGAEQGFTFTVEELREAFKFDWGIRRVEAEREGRI